MREVHTGAGAGTVRLAALIGGGVAVAAALLVRLAAGGAWSMVHHLGAGEVLPPLWILGCLWLGGFFAVGAAIGGLVVAPSRGAAIEADMWRGCTCAVISLSGALIWYMLLFGKGALFLSWLCLPVALVVMLPGVISWSRVSAAATVVAVGWGLWIIMIFAGQLVVMLHS